LFRSDASYILVGGLGGIGRAISLWMADHGAKHLIFVNRSGILGESAQNTVRTLRSKSVTVTVHACDIADEAQVSEMLSTIAETEPPIRGLIHGAMTLKVDQATI
jgi:Short-chain dehydrogenases of various substrate specificities